VFDIAGNMPQQKPQKAANRPAPPQFE